MAEELNDLQDDPDECAHCDTPYELVRPGKSQPMCDCHVMLPEERWALRVEVLTSFLQYDPWVAAPVTRRDGSVVSPERLIYFKAIPYAVGWKPDQIRPATPDDMGLPVDQGRGYLPDPTTIPDDAILVMEALHQRGEVLAVWKDFDGEWVGQVTFGQAILSEERAPSFGLAVCKAAVAAKSGWL